MTTTTPFGDPAAEDRKAEIGKLIRKSFPADKSDENIRKFLHSPAGYDAIFGAIDTVARTHFKTSVPVFFSRKDFYGSHGAKIKDLVDVHTHCTMPKTAGDNPDAFHARGMWWFCPDRYKNLTVDVPAQVTLGQSNGSRPCVSTLYSDYAHLLIDADRRNAEIERATFVLSNAPATASPTYLGFEEMDTYVKCANDAAAAATTNGTIRFHGTGWIESSYAADPPHVPERNRLQYVGDDRPRFWKFYEPEQPVPALRLPGLDYNDPIPTACRQLLACRSARNPIVCIHLGQEFNPMNAGTVAWETDCSVGKRIIEWLSTLSRLGKAGPNMTTISFIVFHAGFAEHWYVAQAMAAHDNIFADTAAMFSENLLALGRASNPEHPARLIRELLAQWPRLKDDPERHANSGIAASRIGKRLLWGTDTIWRGSPYWEAEAFERLNISGEPSEPEWEREFKKCVLYKNARRRLGL